MRAFHRLVDGHGQAEIVGREHDPLHSVQRIEAGIDAGRIGDAIVEVGAGARWFHALYEMVLKDFIGPGKPIFLLQLDNETNFFWDSIYERDRSAGALARYRQFLRDTYGNSIARLNRSYQASLSDFDHLMPPENELDLRLPGKQWHYDWYLFHDQEIRDYYRFLRATWEKLGVHEPDILFTSCDSFNAPDHGLLPRLDYREDGKLSLTTMNIYPKRSALRRCRL